MPVKSGYIITLPLIEKPNHVLSLPAGGCTSVLKPVADGPTRSRGKVEIGIYHRQNPLGNQAHASGDREIYLACCGTDIYSSTDVTEYHAPTERLWFNREIGMDGMRNGLGTEKRGSICIRTHARVGQLE
ncbi:uncharacterized protein H6S33_006289 [Morchella sextelata]|uniref:uncharacterized protein n=1 Tax=Morchella sextelata TaxID=1174677 RepID=UPI001D04AE58|nr:uncharacterized protein H6S33_006289 [Morchella sextelata]KAH0604621.1 hypothetical protein H6S33_006289 [Morchella sextelata]